MIFRLYDGAKELLSQSIPLSQIKATGIFEQLIRMKYEIPNEDLSKFEAYETAVDEAISQVTAAYA